MIKKIVGVALTIGVAGGAGYAVASGNSNNKIKELQNTNTQISQELADEKDKNAIIEESLTETQLALTQKTVDLETKTQQLTAANTSLSEANAKVTTLEGEVEEYKTEVSTLTSQKSALEFDVAEKQSQIETLQNTIKTNEELSAAEIAELNSQITTLQNQVTAKQNQITSLNSQLSTAQTNYNNKVAELNSVKAERDNLQTRVTTLETQIETLNTQIETLQDRITELENNQTQTQVAVASVSDFRIEDGYITAYHGNTSTLTDMVFPDTYSLDSSGNPIDGEDFTIKGLRSSILTSCSTLKTVVIPDTFTKIGRDCFRNCANIKYNEYDNGCYIGSETNPYMFLATVKSTDISSITIHPDTKIIGGAFRECTALTEVTIPEGVAALEDYAFYGCSALTTLSLPNTLERVGRNCFGANSLTYTEYNNGKYLGNTANPYMVLVVPIDSTATSFVAHENTKIVGGYPGNGFRSGAFTSITLPDGLLSIADYTFQECNSLTTINLGNSIKYIGENAFMNSGLTSVTIPATAVGLYMAFYGCKSLTDVTIAEGLEFNAYNTFYNCTALTNISYTRTNELDGFGSYSYKDGVLTILSMSDFDTKPIWAIDNLSYLVKEVNFACQPTHISKSCFQWFASLETLQIPNSVTSIATTAFSSCSKLTNLTLPDNLQYLDSVAFKSIGTLAFNSLNGGYYLGSESNPYLVLVDVDADLTEFTVPEDTKFISNFAFQDSGSTLTNIVLPEGLISITHGAFISCSALTTITLPSTLTYLTTYSFYGCSSLHTINLSCKVPPTIKYQVKDMVLAGVTINIPADSLALYNVAEYWSTCGANFVELEA